MTDQKTWPQPPVVIGGAELVNIGRQIRSSEWLAPLYSVAYFRDMGEYRSELILYYYKCIRSV